MKEKGKKGLTAGILLLCAFILWTLLVMHFDVRPWGLKGTEIGFAVINTWFRDLTGANMMIYQVTDILIVVPIAVSACFMLLGLVQCIKRRNPFKVDSDILLLGVHYLIIILLYIFFDKFIINYRSVLIEGVLEPSYPSTTTLVVLGVMPTLKFQIDRRAKSKPLKAFVAVFVVLFSLAMVVGRTISGVHWLSDIIGSVFLSLGLYMTYRSIVLLIEKE